MNILVTGCAGFIGFHLVRHLLSSGSQVVGIDNLDPYYDITLKYARLCELGIKKENMVMGYKELPVDLPFRFYCLNIEDKEELDQLFIHEHFDVVCNLAAQAGVRYSLENPQQYISTNIQGFFNILENCRQYQVSRLIFASSSSVYGKNNKVPYREEDKTETPVSLYAATKKSGELLAHSYAELYGIQITGLRFFTVYGPWGRPDMAPFLFTQAILEEKTIKVFNHGNMYRDFTYIDDIVKGICHVLFSVSPKKEFFKVYNIGNATPVKLSEFIHVIEKITGKEAHCLYEPMQPGDIKITWADVSHLKEDFNYKPDVRLEVGLRAFIEWYKSFYHIT